MVIGKSKNLIITDYHPKVLENAQYNVQLNHCQDSIQVKELDWFKVVDAEFTLPVEPHEVVIAADVIYDK